MASHELNGTKEKKAVMILDETKEESAAIETSNKSFYDKVWPVIACGAGLFSDGYLNGVSASEND